MQPTEIRLPCERRSLEITWPDGVRQDLSAQSLRRLSRSARSVSDRLDDMPQAVDAGLTIEALNPVGQYAINILFSDGYDNGIYPWEMLRNADQ